MSAVYVLDWWMEQGRTEIHDVPQTVPAELPMIPMIRTLAWRMFLAQVATSAPCSGLVVWPPGTFRFRYPPLTLTCDGL